MEYKALHLEGLKYKQKTWWTYTEGCVEQRRWRANKVLINLYKHLNKVVQALVYLENSCSMSLCRLIVACLYSNDRYLQVVDKILSSQSIDLTCRIEQISSSTCTGELFHRSKKNRLLELLLQYALSLTLSLSLWYRLALTFVSLTKSTLLR